MCPSSILRTELSELIGPRSPAPDTACEILVCVSGAPVGVLDPGQCFGQSDELRRDAVWAEIGQSALQRVIRDSLPLAETVCDRPPTITVVVCTRDRPEDLRRCLKALAAINFPGLEVLVVDNASRSDETARVAASLPGVRYLREERPGLDWARNTGIREARGEVVAFTDDDVVVDPEWVGALALLFRQAPEVDAVTGLVLPAEQKTEAQRLFEAYGGFRMGYARRWLRAQAGGEPPPEELSGSFGAGANMAFRRSIFEALGGFDPALDAGTVTRGGGDLEMFHRVIRSGGTLVYEPEAIVYHRHRRELGELRWQLEDWGTSFIALAERSSTLYPGDARAYAKLVRWWYVHWMGRRALKCLLGRSRFPLWMLMAELRGALRGKGKYDLAQTEAGKWTNDENPDAQERVRPSPVTRRERRIAVRTLELSKPIEALSGLDGYTGARLYVTCFGIPLGFTEFNVVADGVGGVQLRDEASKVAASYLWQHERDAAKRWLIAKAAGVEEPLPLPSITLPLEAETSASIVLATYDRPDDLRRCLDSLLAQKVRRRLEIVVIDNHPDSGITAPVVAEFPGVVLVNELRQGLSYARNRGFAAAKGDILVATDDDVIFPNDWLETLLTPFTDPNVMAVTGNVLPIELETESQRLFELYGGLGKGFGRLEADGDWFRRRRNAVPTWDLGATANAAFRASLFSEERVGLLEESLGAGMPTGCSEDSDLFYRILKAGFKVVYEPRAFVWHRHRTTMPALHRQLHAYSKGHVASNLLTLFRDGDWRAVRWLLISIPLYNVKQICACLRGKNDYPLSLALAEIWGHLVAPWALATSQLRVRREGRSDALRRGDAISGKSRACAAGTGK